VLPCSWRDTEDSPVEINRRTTQECILPRDCLRRDSPIIPLRAYGNAALAIATA